MCASFMIKQRNPDEYGLNVVVRTDLEEYYDYYVVPYRMAPVILSVDKENIVRPMQFSLVPRWSKERKVTFATHNARVESVEEKPTWRDAFRKRHCLVPLTHFIEPIYSGEFAGFMVAFHRTDQNVLLAAGIWEEWVDKNSGEVLESFSIITSEPPEFIARVGHDRCPIFLNPSGAQSWISDSLTNPKDFLLSNKADLNLEVEKFRPMKPGWEKRA